MDLCINKNHLDHKAVQSLFSDRDCLGWGCFRDDDKYATYGETNIASTYCFVNAPVSSALN